MNSETKNFNKKHIYLIELINSITHGLGIALSVAGLVLLVVFASIYQTTWHIVSFSIFGASAIFLYTASTLYHSAVKARIKIAFQKLDHSAIYVLIAGTYTPYSLVTLQGTYGWILFGIIWTLAISGVIFQVFFYKEKYRLVSALLYVAMGWLAVLFVKPLVHNLPLAGSLWLLAGGITYSLGVIFYIWRKLPFNHGIWHLFVLGGTICHFFSIFWYV